MATVGALIEKGNDHLKRSEFAEAEDAFRQATEADDGNAEAHYLLGAAITWRDELREAEAEYRLAIQRNEENPEYHDALGNVLFKDFRFPEAEAAFLEALRQKEKPRYTLHLATVLEAQDKYTEASDRWLKGEAGYRERYNHEPSADAALGLAQALSGQQRWPDAIGILRESIQQLSDDEETPELHRALGDVLFNAQKYEDAENSYRWSFRLQANDPMRSVMHNALGVTLLRLQRHSEAEAELRRAIALAKDWHDPYVNLGQVFAAETNYQDAESCVRESIKLQPRNPAAYRILAEILRRRGRLEEALAQIQLAFLRDRADWYAWDTFALIHLDLADRYHDSSFYEDAVEACDEAFRSPRYQRRVEQWKRTDAPLLYLHRGYANVGLRQFRKAKKDFESSARLADEFSSVHFAARANVRRIAASEKKDGFNGLRHAPLAVVGLALAAWIFGLVRAVQGEIGGPEFVALTSVMFVAVVAAFFLPELTKLKLGPAELSKEASAAPSAELPTLIQLPQN